MPCGWTENIWQGICLERIYYDFTAWIIWIFGRFGVSTESMMNSENLIYI